MVTVCVYWIRVFMVVCFGVQLDAIVQHFQSSLLRLTQQEPAFWQLQIVEFISGVWRSQLLRSPADQKAHRCDVESSSRSEDPFAPGENDDEKLTKASLVAQIETEVGRWMLLLEKCGSGTQCTRCEAGKTGHGDMEDCTQDNDAMASQATAFQCLDEFWKLLMPDAPTLELPLNEDDDEENDYLFERNAVLSGGAYELITFDDFSDDCGSARM